jgi:hypothetical protein
MLGLGIQVMLYLTDVGAPVGKEHHALVHVHPLAFQKLEETALRLFVIRLDESEAMTRSILGHRFADDHFEVRLGAGIRISPSSASQEGGLTPRISRSREHP